MSLCEKNSSLLEGRIYMYIYKSIETKGGIIGDS
nr:MAG TPA: hypothetical protein [Caudoviricetes sp.]